ncbi:MAG: RING finger protein [Pirellulaceae bacterium]|jgi:hypothetical protein|nr:RING finger protein [Pirellulaceae bacterium]MDP7017197.1 RING finger protein [Pirellulaceae bacterium]
MECFLVFLFVSIVLTVMGALGASTRARSSRLENSFRHIAQRYGGSFVSGGWFSRPVVHFRYGHDRIHVTIHTSRINKRNYTHIGLDWPDGAFRCEIMSRWAYIPNQLEFRGLHESLAGDISFDRDYVVLTDDHEELRRLLTPGVMMLVNRLRGLFGDNFVHLSFNHGSLSVVKQRLVEQNEPLESYLRSFLELYDQAMLTRTVGIEFSETGDGVVLTEAVCQVCGEDIVTDMVFCQRCRTPHHRDCWDYIGACSVYGCQEVTYFTPQIASPTHRDLKTDSPE